MFYTLVKTKRESQRKGKTLNQRSRVTGFTYGLTRNINIVQFQIFRMFKNYLCML